MWREQSMDRTRYPMVMQIVNQLLDRLSNLLLFFGLALLTVGAGVQITRDVRLRQVEHTRPAPSFQASLRRSAPALSPEPTGTPEPTPAPLPPRRIVIPSVKIDTPVVDVGWEARVIDNASEGNEWQTADYAAGFHKLSAMPGQAGNTVISGHNNTRGAVFRDLYEVQIGDRVYVYNEIGHLFVYEVVESFVVREEGATDEERRNNTHWIRGTPDIRLTLVSCFPPWSNTHRVIVVAFPVADVATPAPPAEPFR